MNQSAAPNKLVHSASPYLKQHAYNPVQWHPWGKEALQKAMDEDKPMIISIGYSACHWCHVMERESFEDDGIAKVMNEGFICIKVDREERPDVDQIYMEAIQTMGLNGGWPLNVFALPNQKPFYGGTYFQPNQWLHILKSIRQAFLEKRGQLEDSAREFARAISITDSEKYGLSRSSFSASHEKLSGMVNSMKNHFDKKEGGLNRAPKFPNPSIWRFLLTANSIIKDREVHDQIMLTLKKMADGGIYDQIGGGFARYSVDEKWFAPHFEKMLYDNGQLISLYSMAYQVEKRPRFREVVYESIEFVRREMTSQEYGFYSALDADSEGEEGNFYIWGEEELDKLLGEDRDLIKEYFNTTSEGNWERGFNILHTSGSAEDFAITKGMLPEEFKSKLSAARSILHAHRENRERPGLDDKILTSWNTMIIKGLVDAFHAFDESSFLDFAERNASFIRKELINDNTLLRSRSGESEVIRGFLDDYAFAVEGFYALYQATFKDQWLDLALALTDYAIDHFYDPAEEMFFYTDITSEQLITRKKEIFDNVIPASNSVMAQNLYVLGNLIEKETYLKISRNMISKIAPMLSTEPQYLSNWGTLYALQTGPTPEIAVVGKDYLSYARELQRYFMPNKIVSATDIPSDLPLLKHRKAIEGKTTIYVCFNKSCKLPVHSINEALEQLEVIG